ncbi:hypothetical protein Q8F55_005299 [Vanrija albida]|uniref:Glycosyltransferase family 31 protein n=1 Tax=Vanrija albida TaxID=181172 RepID=A0ABR3Q1Y9_9TREE
MASDQQPPRRQGTWPPPSDQPDTATVSAVADSHDTPGPSSRRSSNDTHRSDAAAAAAARPPFPSLSTGPTRRWIPHALDIETIASPSSPVQGDDETFVTHSPITPTTSESNVHRRRMSVGPAGPVLGRRRSLQTLVDRSSAAVEVPVAHGQPPSRASLDAHRVGATASAPPATSSETADPLPWQPSKHSPIVHEYIVQSDTAPEPKQPRRKHWPSISDTAAMASTSTDPLPQDPNNLLPLSTPRTPLASPSAVSDAATDYIGFLNASSDDGALPRVSTSSPRTSTSTMSSRWEQRAYSQSSESEDDAPDSPFWWFRSDDGSSGSRVTSSLLPSVPRILPIGTRHWGWLLGPLHRVLPASTERQAPKRRVSKRRRAQQLSEKEKMIEEPWTAGRLVRLLQNFVRNEPWGVVLFFAFFLLFALVLTCTIKYILDPDKRALPFREYCTANYPTLYSLQGKNPFLTPLTPSDSLWPYPGRQHVPYADGRGISIDSMEPTSVLIGIFTYDKGRVRRDLVRQTYMTHARSRRAGTEGVSVKFIMGRPRPELSDAIALEQETHNDIVILDIEENMNSGKTHAYFTWAAENATVPDYEYPTHPRSKESEAEFALQASAGGSTKPIYRGDKRPDYVLKADDDAFLMLGELERHLRASPRRKAFWGYLVRDLFMAGECYGMSFDLVKYIGDTPSLNSMIVGKEDKLTSKWMRLHPQAKEIVWVTDRCGIYDHPKAGTVYSHGFLFPDEIARIRDEQLHGIPSDVVDQRGGSHYKANAYSTVAEFGTKYRPPVLNVELNETEQVEALIEGSPLSKLRDVPDARWTTTRAEVEALMAKRPSHRDRFLGDEAEYGGTILVHFLKKAEWFREAAAAFLGDA